MPRAINTFRDDRGRACIVKAPALVTTDERMGDPRFALAVRRAMTLKPELSGKYLLIFLTRLLPYVAACIVGAAFGSPVWLTGVILFPALWFINAKWPIQIEDRLSPRLATHWLGIGLCPSCLYGLAEIPPAGDGAIVCPECGAAWKQDRLQGTGRFDADGDGVKRAVATARAYGAHFQQGIFIKDARAQRVPMAVTILADRIIEAQDDDLRERLAKGAKVIRRSGRLLRWGVAGFFAALGLFMLSMQIRFMRGLIPSLGGVAMLCFPFLMAAGVFWGDFAYNHKGIAKKLLALRLCPSCGADLRGAAPDGELVQCACGACWKLRPAPSSL